jgi:hypothetical protein
MIVYEITATVEKELIVKFEQFIQETHIPDLLKTGYFEGAEIARISEGKYRVRYLAEKREILEKYFETEAEGLREDFIKTFPEGILVSREILEVLQVWKSI